MFDVFFPIKNMPHTHHSRFFGPNFIDLKIRGPMDLSELKVNGEHYRLP